MSREEYRNAAIDAVKKLSADVGIPSKNDRIKEADLDNPVRDALADACAPGNPRDAKHILKNKEQDICPAFFVDYR